MLKKHVSRALKSSAFPNMLIFSRKQKIFCPIHGSKTGEDFILKIIRHFSIKCAKQTSRLKWGLKWIIRQGKKRKWKLSSITIPLIMLLDLYTGSVTGELIWTSIRRNMRKGILKQYINNILTKLLPSQNQNCLILLGILI